jgi:PPP family 3-phenylpropionic acid transporter
MHLMQPLPTKWTQRIAYETQSQKDAVRSLSLLSLLSFGALGFIAPFVNLYMKEAGLSATSIGFLISLGALLELTVNPLINSWADRNQRHLLVLRLQMSLMALAALIFALTAVPLFLGIAFLLNAVNGRGANENLSQLTMTRLEEFRLRTFGKVRLWGSVGWATATLISSPVIALGGYVGAFMASALVRLSLLPVTRSLPPATNSDTSDEGSKAPANSIIYVLMLTQFIFFIGLNAFSAFIWIHFRENLGILPEHVGFFAAAFAISEFIPLLIIDRIIDRFGVRNIVIIGMVGMSLEWLLYGIIPSAGWVFLMAVLRAMTFTMFIIGMTIMISDISTRKRVATNRALIQVTMPALAILISSPAMGWIYDNLGATALFATSSIIGLIACMILISQYKRLRPMPVQQTAPQDFITSTEA